MDKHNELRRRVAKGEEPPKMGDVGPVEGVAKKQCNMTIPYAVEGEKQSEVNR